MPDKTTITYVKCPTCDKSVAWIEAEKWKPFCSERCKLIDLGEWISEKQCIPGDPSYTDYPDDEDFQQ